MANVIKCFQKIRSVPEICKGIWRLFSLTGSANISDAVTWGNVQCLALPFTCPKHRAVLRCYNKWHTENVGRVIVQQSSHTWPLPGLRTACSLHTYFKWLLRIQLTVKYFLLATCENTEFSIFLCFLVVPSSLEIQLNCYKLSLPTTWSTFLVTVLFVWSTGDNLNMHSDYLKC